MTENGFIKTLDTNPDDWSCRLQYSDWLEEQGREVEANCQRWMADNQRHPFLMTSFSEWDWYPLGTSAIYSGLEDNLLSHVKKSIFIKKEGYGWVCFSTRQEAELALAGALDKLDLYTTNDTTKETKEFEPELPGFAQSGSKENQS